MRTTLAAIAILTVWATISAAATDSGREVADPLFEASMSEGDALLAGGDYPAAERAYRAALRQVPERAERREARADALHKLGLALAYQSRYDDAESLIGEAETLARAAPGTRSLLLVDVLRAKTVLLHRSGRIDEARAVYRDAKTILEDRAAVWRTAPDGTTWIHTLSDWRFPADAAPFQRIRRTMLDDDGRNVVVHYRIGPGGSGATLVSVYLSIERGVPLAAEFAASKREILRQYPGARSLSDGLRTAAGIAGFEVVLDLPPADDGSVHQTAFSAFEAGKVTIRVRASYPKAEAATRAAQVATLIDLILRGATSP